jgi:hypothetical protein
MMNRVPGLAGTVARHNAGMSALASGIGWPGRLHEAARVRSAASKRSQNSRAPAVFPAAWRTMRSRFKHRIDVTPPSSAGRISIAAATASWRLPCFSSASASPAP